LEFTKNIEIRIDCCIIAHPFKPSTRPKTCLDHKGLRVIHVLRRCQDKREVNFVNRVPGIHWTTRCNCKQNRVNKILFDGWPAIICYPFELFDNWRFDSDARVGKQLFTSVTDRLFPFTLKRGHFFMRVVHIRLWKMSRIQSDIPDKNALAQTPQKWSGCGGYLRTNRTEDRSAVTSPWVVDV
jgi:hypothetical protein